MSRLVRATEVVGLPVVTSKGDDVAEVRDVVYEPAGGLIGFTLNRRGYLSGSLKQVLTVDGVTSIGRDAVMTGTEEALTEKADVPSGRRSGRSRCIGASVVTGDGTALGEVIGVILSVDDHAEAVGYELLSNGAEARHAFVLSIVAHSSTDVPLAKLFARRHDEESREDDARARVRLESA